MYTCIFLFNPFIGSDVHVHVFNPFPGSDVQQNCITELSGTKEELGEARSASTALFSQVAALTKEKQVW